MPQVCSPVAKSGKSPVLPITAGWLTVTAGSLAVAYRVSCAAPSRLPLLTHLPLCATLLLAAGAALLYRFTAREFRRAQDEVTLLRAEGGRFRAMFELAGVGVALVDPRSGRFLDTNQKFCEIVGYSAQELSAKTYQEITHPDDLPHDLERVDRIKKGEVTTFSWEKRYFHRSGKVVQVRLTVSRLWSEGEEPAAQIAVIQDISAAKEAESALHDAKERLEERVRERTAELERANAALEGEVAERRGAEEALRGSEERFRLFMENNPTATFIVDRQGVLRYLNPTYYRMFLVPDGTLEGVPFPEIFPPEVAASYLENNRRVFEAGGTVEAVEPGIRRDGSPGEYLVYKFLLPTAGGEPLLGGIAADITDLKEAQRSIAFLNQQLRQRVEEMELLLHTAPIGLAIARDPLAQTIRGNATLEGFLGVACDSELSLTGPGTPLYRVLRDGRHLAVGELPLQRAARGERVTGESLEFLRGDGTTLHVHSCASPLFNAEGEVTGAVGAFMDITERKRSEEELRLHRDHLDTLVKERTAELAARNAQLAVEIEERRGAQQVKGATIRLLRLCNEAGTTAELAQELVRFFREFTGCEAAALRLRDQDDYPYVVTDGFPGAFVSAESHLCEVSGAQFLRDRSGKERLSCLCGMAISGSPEEDFAPSFTAAGSFWTDDVAAFAARLAQGGTPYPLRSGCREEGYRSVVLIPLRSQGETFGLVQLNDRRPGFFTPETVALAETLVSYAAIALAKARSDEALHESARALREAQQIARIGSYRYDFGTDRWTSSEVLDAIFGIDAGFERSGAGWQGMVHPGDREPLDAYLAGVVERGEHFNFEYRIVRAADGCERWVHVVGELEYGEGGRPLRLVGTVQDVTRRKRGEQALKSSERRFRTLIERAPVAVGIFRAACIVYANRKLLDMFGCGGLDEVRGRSVGVLTAPACREEVVQRALQRAVGLSVPSEYEALALRSDGGEFPVHVAATPVLLADGVATIAFFHDVSERKRAEEEVRRYTRRLIELEEELRKRVAAELHDDIGQELTALGLNLSFISGMLKDVGSGIGSRLNDSRAIARGISRTVRDMMTELRPPQLDELGLAAALRLHAELFGNRTGIEAVVDAAEELPPLSVKTETALFRIAQEALTNVAKHAHATRAEVVLAPSGGGVRLSVQDNGTGFVSGTAHPSGGGWGLTVMRERSALIGGSFDVLSPPGEGTAIVVEVEEEV